MLSRSHLLIQKELKSLSTSSSTGNPSLWGIDVSLINDNIYEWSAQICGPVGTPWEGGVFRVYLKFDEYYNNRPPRVCFHTIPYHPNIDMITGKPCIDYLDDYSLWEPNIKMSTVLLQIQNMLDNPVTDNAVNIEAAEMLATSPYTYNKIVRECVEYSRLINSGEFKAVGEKQSVVPASTRPAGGATEQISKVSKQKRITKLSFDDYLTQWNGMATTKPNLHSINTYLDAIKDDSLLKKIHFDMTEEEMLDEEYDKQMEYDAVYYGSIYQKKPSAAEKSTGRDSKLARINQMRKIYLPKKPLPTPRSPTRHSDSEGEHDNLVTWTKNLNAEDLDN